ncbi:MAG: RNA methyltransferase [Bdellovibrionaceae bacterium]|nr:RNA methyltransferase [Pseudobdellovibrionaceae bacterium]
MARYLAMTSRGLVDALHDELIEIGAKNLDKEPGGVFFDGNWSVVMRANLRLRTATRIVKPILSFPAYKNEDLYNNILKFDFTKMIEVDGTLAVEASVRECAFKDQRFVAMKVKDAVVDQFREKLGARPSVDNENPDLVIVVRGYKNHFDVSLDTSGDALFKRGYRVATGEAPIKEHVAAGLLKLAEWDGVTPIVDPMCGSGTILIEAAMMAKKMAPGTLRKSFGFMKWKGYDREVFKKELETVLDVEETATEKLIARLTVEDEEGVEKVQPMFYGYDLDAQVIKAAKANAKEAGVDDIVVFRRHAMETLEAPCEKGVVITNPPYGTRLGNKESLKDVYKDFAFTLKNRFKGWTAFVLSGDPELSSAMKLKATRRAPVYNGNIECRLLKYEMF